MAYEPAAQVLVVSADPSVGRSVLPYLEARRYAVELADSTVKAFNLLDRRRFDVVVTELHIERLSGMRVMALAKDRNPEGSVVLLAETPDIEIATEAMRQGAYDFQIKPVNVAKLEAVIKRSLEHQHLILQHHELRRLMDERYGLRNLIGRSHQMMHVYSTVREIAPTASNVLIEGESGTGKDLIAQAIHNSSPRRDAAFVRMSCTSLPESVLATELFGHTANALPDMREARAGRLELAEGGTLYLDDVEALSQDAQDWLAEALRTGRFARIGGTRPARMDVRILSASRSSLRQYVSDGAFREDLYRLLAPVVIEAPALRDRAEDIPLLAAHFLQETALARGKHIDHITRNAVDVLTRFDWPGNARQLRNVIDGMVVAARDHHDLDLPDLPGHIRQGAHPEADEIRIPAGATMAEIERIAIETTMKACGDNKEACAKTLGIGLRTLYRKLKEYEERG